MSVWRSFCETFCCFLLPFLNWLRSTKRNRDADDNIERGDSIFTLPRTHQQHQRQHSSSSRPIPLAPIYPGRQPSSSAPKPKKHSPPRTLPRSIPLPVNYPPTQTPTGKHFRHHKPVANRMKPLPPLRTTFDGGGRVKETSSTFESSRTDKSPTGSSSDATFRTPAPAYSSAAPSAKRTASPISMPSVGGFPMLLEELKTGTAESVRVEVSQLIPPTLP
ncbi:MAG: hypothetical protein Q9184_001878 [Pyrenodesmia sp. 2 TL-2023]